MLKKSVAAVSAAAMVLSAASGITASETAAEASETANHSVSGYVSVTDNGGLKLAGEDKTPTIHVDFDDYEGVIRAAGDLSDDIESVTGVAPEMDGQSAGISINGGSMKVSLAVPVQADAQCYVAVYDGNGTLAGIEKSTDKLTATGGVIGFTFEKALTVPEGGEIKAFAWSNDMEPLTDDPMGMAEDKTVDLDKVDIVIGTL